MRVLLTSLFCFLLLAARSLPAQVPADDAAWTAETGDAWVDARLADMERYAARHRDAFVDEIVRYHGAPRALVEGLMAGERRWRPGEVYFACALAHVQGRTCREVVDARLAEPAEHWAGEAARWEAGPGTSAFERVRRGIVASYDRWARPIELDAALKRALPGRERPRR